MKSLVKTVFFYCVALIGIPLLFFVGLEKSLQIIGIGQSRSFYSEVVIDDNRYYQANPAFIEQFYPASLGITPVKRTFSADPNDNRARIFVLGGSAARGFPDPNHGVSRHLEALLADAAPSRPFDVINTAMTAINSHVVYQIAQDIPGRPMDFAVILVGNNEVVGPYGPSTFNQNFLSNLRLIRGLQALKQTRLWQAFAGAFQPQTASSAKEALRWRGMQMFTDNVVLQDDTRLKAVYKHYDANLRDTIDVLQGKGMHVIVSTVPVNLRHSAPFGSAHGKALTNLELSTWSDHLERGEAAIKQSRWRAAAEHLEAAMNVSDGHAQTQFLLATALERLGNHTAAKVHYQNALDRDTLRFRADSQLNDSVRRVAKDYKNNNFTFIDSEQLFKKYSAPYAAGWNLLLEHVHYDFSGNYLLASTFAKTVLDRVIPTDQRPLVEPETLAEQLGYPNFTTIEAMGRLLDMVQLPPFTGQSNHDDLINFIDRRGAALAGRLNDFESLIERRQTAINQSPDNWQLHFELAVLYRQQNNIPEALNALNKALSINPHHDRSLQLRSEISAQTKNYDDAISDLERLRFYMAGDTGLAAQTLGALGSAYLNSNRYHEGIPILLELIDQYPSEIESVLRAYGTLIKDSVGRGLTSKRLRYLADLNAYASALIRDGRAGDYPLLFRRMAQILSLAGEHQAARQWAEQDKMRQPAA